MQIRAVAPDDFHLVLDLLEQAFPDVSRSFFHSITQYDPWRNDRFSLAVEVNNKLVSFLQIFDRTMQINNQSIRFGGIGSVGTHPHHTGKGYASLLLNHARDVMANEGLAGGLLFTKIHPFYERLGWKTLPLHEQKIKISQLHQIRQMGFSNRIIKETDLDAVHSIYQQEQNIFPGTILRTVPYWQKRMHWMNHSCRLIEKEGVIVGYFFAAKYRENVPVLHITEYGLHYHDDMTVHAFFDSAVQLAQEMACTILCSNFSIHPTLNRFIGQNKIHTTESPYNYILWLDVQNEGMFEALNQQARENRVFYWQTDAF